MNAQLEKILTDDEIEILKEIMNIAFGKSAAGLADVIDTHVVLNVPYMKIMHVSDIPDYFSEHVRQYESISVIEQKFRGRFRGDALLVFSSGAGKELVNMLCMDERSGLESDHVEILEREALMEIGNILIGACVGKITEMLKDIVTYTPPMIIVEKSCHDAFFINRFDPESTAIVLKTDFRFEQGNVSGFLFLITSQKSVAWLKDALREFIEQYE